MAIGSWVVSSIISFSSNGPLVLGRIASSAALANTQLQRQQGILTANQAAMMRYTARMEEAQLAARNLGTKVAGIGFAIGASALVYATSEAAKFERAMTGVQIATDASGKAFKDLGAMAFHVSGITAQSAVTIAEEMAAAAQVAFKSPQQLMSIFPMMAKYADTRWIATGGKQDPVETVTLMSQFAHYFSAYSPEQMKPMLDDMARVQFTTHASLQQMVTQGKYFVRDAINAGIPERGTGAVKNGILQSAGVMDYIAIMGQLGLLAGKGGTGIDAAIRYGLKGPQMTGHQAKMQAGAFKDLGLIDSVGHLKFVDSRGNLMMQQMLVHLAALRETWQKTDPASWSQRWSNDLNKVFLTQGGRWVNQMADTKTLAQMARNTAAMNPNRMPGIEGQWKLYSKDLFYEWNAFKTNIQNIGIALALPSLPDIEKGFHRINAQLLALGDFLKANPDVAKRIFEWGIAFTAAFGLRAFVGTVAGFRAFGVAMRALAASSTVSAAQIRAAAIVAGVGGLAAGGGGAAAVAGGAAAGGAAGLLARAGGFFRGAFALVDSLLFAGLGGFVLKVGRGIIGGLSSGVTHALDGTAAGLRFVGKLFFSKLIGAVQQEGARFAAAFWADLAKGLTAAMRIVLTPLTLLKNAVWDFAFAISMRAPMIVDAIGMIGGAIGGLGGIMGRIAAMIPGLDIAAMTLTPTGVNVGEDDWLRAHRYYNRPGDPAWQPGGNQRPRSGGGGHTYITTGDIHVHADDHEDAGRKTFEYLSGIRTSGNATTLRSRQGSNWTHATTGNPATVGAH